MKIECHILQNFPPHCLNRDDTNSPKDCEFGGVRRGRISSQCLKRAVRDAFEQHQTFDASQRAVRTKRIVEQVVEVLVGLGHEAPQSLKNVTKLLEGAKLKTEDSKEPGGAPKTQYLLYLPKRKIADLAAVVDEHWDALSESLGGQEAVAADPEPAKGKAVKKKGKTEKAADVPKAAKDAALALLKDASQAPEVALFGRMIADNPDWNVEAACQVAHAISTHRIAMEFDFFTAVDDLKKDSQTGSDMMGTVQFNSACFYRYAVLDVGGLQANLGGEGQSELVLRATRAFLKAFVHARPTGKQNSMAAHTLPSLVLFTVRDGGEAVSLTNAFVKPVVAKAGESDLVEASCNAILKHFGSISKMYPGGLVAAHASMQEGTFGQALVQQHDSVDDAIAAACGAIAGKAQAA